MPHCRYFGLPADHREVLDWLFIRAACQVYESASEYEKPLRRFCDPDEVLAQFNCRHLSHEPQPSVHLMLYVNDSGPAFTPKRVALVPRSCGGATFRFVAEGWGLISLELSNAADGRLRESWTNHNSRKRAEAWSRSLPDLGEASSWDFETISRFSACLNRHIRGRGVARLGSAVILAGALNAWEAGVVLHPLLPGESVTRLQKAS